MNIFLSNPVHGQRLHHGHLAGSRGISAFTTLCCEIDLELKWKSIKYSVWNLNHKKLAKNLFSIKKRRHILCKMQWRQRHVPSIFFLAKIGKFWQITSLILRTFSCYFLLKYRALILHEAWVCNISESHLIRINFLDLHTMQVHKYILHFVGLPSEIDKFTYLSLNSVWQSI